MRKGKWQVLDREPILKTPHISLTLEQIKLPGGEVITDWPIVHTRDYVSILVINPDGDVLIIEGYKHGLGRSTWQMLTGALGKHEDAFDAAYRTLETAGYECGDLRHLSSYVVEANQHVGTNHCFLATGVLRAPTAGKHPPVNQRWVTQEVLQHALLDGRLGATSYALTAALGLLALQGRNGTGKKTRRDGFLE